jgi:hypothetical protein
VCRQSQAIKGSALERLGTNGDRGRPRTRSPALEKIETRRPRGGCGILIKSGLESCPTRRARAGHEAPLLWFQVDGVLRDLIESSHCLGIGFKSALRHDQIGELGGDVHVG